MTQSVLNEVVQLHYSVSKLPESPPNVRLVSYRDTRDLLSLLNATHIYQLSGSTANPGAYNRNNASGSLVSTPRPSVHDDQSRQTAGGQSEQSDEEREGDEDEPEQPRVEFTEMQVAAASKIITTYRGYAERKAAEKDPLVKMRRRIYKDFLTRSRSTEWRDSPYRFLFLGIAPTLFAVTEILKDYMFKAKSSAKESFRTAHDQELETVQAALDDAS